MLPITMFFSNNPFKNSEIHHLIHKLLCKYLTGV
jgi:hypothetical protein